jgi:L,D-transpeptidase catalytic domain
VAEVLRKTLLLLAVPVVATACGCGTAAESPGTLAALERSLATLPDTPCVPGRESRLGNRQKAYAARALRAMNAYAHPNGRRLRAFGTRNVNGVETVLGVLTVVRDRRCEPAWYRVRLPIRPNGATGYVRADDVRLRVVRTRIEVDLSERRIVFLRGGRTLLRATAGIGAEVTPTPTGRYYVNQRLRAADPSGPFGPGAIGISAFSPVLHWWRQGGPIAIHGTNSPSSIGRRVTTGCLRIANEQLLRMFGAMPEGTPVVIHA